MKKERNSLEIGQDIYVETRCSISNGSSDVHGGLARVTKISTQTSGGEPCLFVEVEELPGHGYNWSQNLSKIQDKLKEEFGTERAYPDPDIDTPWIEDGDWVDGKTYHGPDIW